MPAFTFTEDSVTEIAAKATEAFFRTVSEALPPGTPGDLRPLEVMAFEQAAENAVRAYMVNAGGDPGTDVLTLRVDVTGLSPIQILTLRAALSAQTEATLDYPDVPILSDDVEHIAS